MKNDDEQSSLMVAVIGIIPVIWFALLVAPYLSSGLMGILDGVPEAMNHPFSIRLCGDSVKTVLIFLLSYGARDAANAISARMAKVLDQNRNATYRQSETERPEQDSPENEKAKKENPEPEKKEPKSRGQHRKEAR